MCASRLGRQHQKLLSVIIEGYIMPTVRYKEIHAEYSEETAKNLKEHHNIDLEKELMEALKVAWEEKNNGPLAQR